MFNAPAVKAYREAASHVSSTTGVAERGVGMNEDANATASYDLPTALVEEDRAMHANARAGGSSE